MFRKECFETINITRPRDLQGKLDHSCRLLGKELWHILCIYQLIKITPASRRTRAKLSYRQCKIIEITYNLMNIIYMHSRQYVLNNTFKLKLNFQL